MRLGCSFTDLSQEGERVTVRLTDGSQHSYDLVVGADGVHSRLREMLFPDIQPPQYIGHIEPHTFPDVVARLLRPFEDPLLQELIAKVGHKEAAIDYRPLANLLLPAPWNRGRVLLIGDAVAATTPQLASSAGIGIESGIVLGEELERAPDLQTAFDAVAQVPHARPRPGVAAQVDGAGCTADGAAAPLASSAVARSAKQPQASSCRNT